MWYHVCIEKRGSVEELEELEKLGVEEMTQMVRAYRDITGSPDYAYLERRRLMDKMDENQALGHARREGEKLGEKRGEARSDAKWQGERDKWQGERSELESEIARLRAQLGMDT